MSQDSLREAQRAVDQATARLEEEVGKARTAGLTWQQIGGALGITKQAASQRFNRPPIYNEKAIEQIEKELLLIAEEAFAALAHSDFERLHSLMTYVAARLLSKRKLAKTWEAVTETCGQFIELSNSRLELSGTGYVLTYRLRHRRGEPVGQFTFNNRKQITGWVIFNDDSAELPW